MYKVFGILCATVWLLMASFAFGTEYGPAYDKDVEMFSSAFSSANYDSMDEALVRLRWAGVTDPRIYDPLVEKINQRKRQTKFLIIYVKALSCSGAAKYAEYLAQLAEDKTYLLSIRNAAKDSLALVGKYQKIAEIMSVGSEEASTNKELWALRYKKGLAVKDDRERLRWAARDLYLFPQGKETLDVARQVLQDNMNIKVEDSYEEDALSFLCKALGMSRNSDYKEILVQVANSSPNKKLAEYAEESVQYIDPTFKMIKRKKVVDNI